ncbi:hypothetical protein EK21DRAFT_71044, partial [Setomelanomma holmii]
LVTCTGRQCTSHFGIICTHHQWLTQLSCLSNGFSPDVVSTYASYCSRSVLAKAQLYRWIRTVTDRTWLVSAGDAHGLQTLSPASLGDGYAPVDVVDKAPSCLTDSASVSSSESFKDIMASCGFDARTQHTGNAARPWEFSESLHSLIALDFETVGYDVTQRDIADGIYFERQCFCNLYDSDLETEHCTDSGLGLTRKRLWLNATCGSTSLPDNWMDGLKTTTSAYILPQAWRWPGCVNSMPRHVVGLTDRCMTDACELDSSGYCNVKRAIDRACFCRKINYDTCKQACHIFEARIEYVKWLHDLCGNEEEWHGLPKHWRQQLAVPNRRELLPWRWSIKPTQTSTSTSISDSKYSIPKQICASTDWKLGSLILVNMATIFAGCLCLWPSAKSAAHPVLHDPHSSPWPLRGLAIAVFHLGANWLNAVVVQSTPGYEDVSILRMVFLWCSMPRLTWVTMVLALIQPSGATSFPTVASLLLAEIALQILSAFYMVTAVNYGREHGFYSLGMSRLERAPSAQFLYAGALMWLVVMIATPFLLIQALRVRDVSRLDRFASPMSPQRTENMEANLTALFDKLWASLEDRLTGHWMDKGSVGEQTPLRSNDTPVYTVYGTMPVESPNHSTAKAGIVKSIFIVISSTFLLWIAQWFSWSGFIGLATEEYGPPKLELLTIIWFGFSLAASFSRYFLKE